MIPPLSTLFCLMAMRCGPQRLSAETRQLIPALGLHFGTGVILSTGESSTGYALLTALLATLVLVAVMHAALTLHRRGNRVTQSLAALAWCETLLGLLLLPVVLLEMSDGLSLLLYLLVIGWNLAVAANVFRHALELEKGVAFVYALGYFFIAILVMGMVPSAEAAQSMGVL